MKNLETASTDRKYSSMSMQSITTGQEELVSLPHKHQASLKLLCATSAMYW